MNKHEFDEKLIDRVERAAERGAMEGGSGKHTRYMTYAVIVLLVLLLLGLLLFKISLDKKLNNFQQGIQSQLDMDASAETHDLVLEDEGPMGYTATDFADAVFGDPVQLKKIEVYEAKLSDAVTLTETGLGNLSIFTKTQVITYNGTATYTVDLSGLTEDSIVVDEGEKIVILTIPHAVCGTINIPSNEMVIGDTDRGWLAFGDIQMSADQMAKVETEARGRMEAKLQELNEGEAADRFATMTIWEMYQPVISSVSPEYRLSVRFAD